MSTVVNVTSFFEKFGKETSLKFIMLKSYNKKNAIMATKIVKRFLCYRTSVRCNKIDTGIYNTTVSSNIRTFGQPTYETHPYLVSYSEVTPLIKKTEYQRRRERLVETIGQYIKLQNSSIQQHLIVIPSACQLYMSDKIPYFFRQNTDFLYLTGCQEPDSCLVIAITENDKPVSTLFLREKDEHSELWDGPRTGPKVGRELFGFDQTYGFNELENYLNSFNKSKSSTGLFYDFSTPSHPKVNKILTSYLHRQGKKVCESPKGFIQKLRLIKTAAEIELMQKSCNVASNAIAKTIQASYPGINEAQIFAKVDYECRMNGAEYLAYPPVVAGGNRANTIHYINNNQVVKNGEMVLMDAGCEYHGYSSDITRTWPIDGKFTPQQRELYEVVLKTQKKLIKSCTNSITLDSLFQIMCASLGKGLQDIGLIPKSADDKELKQTAYGFCPHHVSHYLGMDVHDTPTIQRNIPIEPGMIITIEPGLYIGNKYKYLPDNYRGIGIRIEDDILITKEGPVVLTEKCPKEIDDIEKLASAKVKS